MQHTLHKKIILTTKSIDVPLVQIIREEEMAKHIHRRRHSYLPDGIAIIPHEDDLPQEIPYQRLPVPDNVNYVI